jgi:hypothetical protein
MTVAIWFTRASAALLASLCAIGMIGANGARAAVTVAIPVSSDCEIKPSVETGSLCGADTLGVGSEQQKVYVCSDTCSWITANSPVRSLIFFDMSAIPAGSDITSATLSVYAPSTRSRFVPVSVKPALGYWTSTATWLYEDQGTFDPWDEPGADFDASVAYVNVGGSTQAISFNILGLVQEWVGGTRINFGVGLVADDALVKLTLASKEATTAANRPTLNVTYVPGTPPVNTLSGELYADRDQPTDEGRALDGGYVSSDEEVHVDAREGAAGQGVKSVEMLVDGTRLRPEHLYQATCSTTCPATASPTFTMPVAGLATGDHVVSIVTRDAVASATSTIPGAHITVTRFVVNVGPSITVPVYTPPGGPTLAGAPAAPSFAAPAAPAGSERDAVARVAAEPDSDLGRVVGGRGLTVAEVGTSGALPVAVVKLATPIARLDEAVTCTDADSRMKPIAAHLVGRDVSTLLVTLDAQRAHVICIDAGPGADAALRPDPGQLPPAPATTSTIE